MTDTNLTRKNRAEMIEFLEKIKSDNKDDETLKMVNRIEKELTEKKFGLVFEEHREEVDDLLQTNIPVLCEDAERRICKDKNLPRNFIIEGDNLQALYLLLKTHKGKINVIYIDPPYNTGAKDWKYNNDYVDSNDGYRHSKWLSMMKVRLELAKQLLNPENSVLICTIDEKEYLHLGCLLEEMFPDANIQMITDVINPRGTNRENEFSRVEEYIFVVRIGSAAIIKTENNMLGNTDEGRKGRVRDSFNRSNNLRHDHNNQFFPIYIDEKKQKIIKVGEPMDINTSQEDFPKYEGLTPVFPVRSNGEESSWRAIAKTTREWIDKGYVRIVGYDKKNKRWLLNYIPSGLQKKIENKEIVVDGRMEDGALNIKRIDEIPKNVAPKTVWNVKRHNATDYGIATLNEILSARSFSYPKSLYSVYDVLFFFISDKPDAIVLDFFAGSGTTQHAVNLMNRWDNGQRKCIMVTNNELSHNDEKNLSKKGYKKGDPEREALGIAKFVTRPRIKFSIEGTDYKGSPLVGDYLISDINGEPIQKKEGFMCNVKYFKCDWKPRKPEDYYLTNVLLLHIKEMIELENAIEIDNVKNVAILNKKDYNSFIENENIYKNIENIRASQKIIFEPKEIEKMKKKNFKYIPEEYFGQELKDVAE